MIATKTVRIDPELHKQAKALAALQGRPIYDVINELVEKWIEAAADETTDETPPDQD